VPLDLARGQEGVSVCVTGRELRCRCVAPPRHGPRELTGDCGLARSAAPSWVLAFFARQQAVACFELRPERTTAVLHVPTVFKFDLIWKSFYLFVYVFEYSISVTDLYSNTQKFFL